MNNAQTFELLNVSINWTRVQIEFKFFFQVHQIKLWRLNQFTTTDTPPTIRTEQLQTYLGKSQ